MATLYLAGNIDGCTMDACNGWRERLTAMLKRRGHATLNPLRGKEGCFEKWEGRDTGHTVTDAGVIVTRDLWDLEQADGIIANVGPADAILTGTVCEAFYASRIRRPAIPVFAFVVDGEEPARQVRSPWFGQFFSPAYHVHSEGGLVETIGRYFG